MEAKPFVVRGYGRASTDKQDLSCDQQQAVIEAAFKLYVQARPDWAQAQWGGFYKDEGVTRTSKFREREAGSTIMTLSKPGDVILVSNFDRIFANVIDVCEMFEVMAENQFRILILDMDIPISTDLGQCVFKIMAAVKEMEVKEIRRRIKDAKQHYIAEGRPISGKYNCPVGWTAVAMRVAGKAKPQWYYLPDHNERRIAKALRLRHTEDGLGYRRLVEWANKQLPNPRGRFWSTETMKVWIIAADKEFPLLNGRHVAAPIPPDAEPVYGPDTIPDPDQPKAANVVRLEYTPPADRPPPKRKPKPSPEPPEPKESILDLFKTGLTS